MASCTASLVTALNTTRSTRLSFRSFLLVRISWICHEIASPSRSGSVARMTPVGALDRDADVAEPLGGLGVDLPAHGEIMVRIDRAVLGREVAHVAEGGVDAIVLAEIFVDGLGLCRRLDDHDFHSTSILGRAPGPRFTSPGRPGSGIWRRKGRVSILGADVSELTWRPKNGIVTRCVARAARAKIAFHRPLTFKRGRHG